MAVYTLNPCKIGSMRSLSQSLSMVSLSTRKSLALCFLLIGLIGTQWIGLWHSISHTNAQIQKISASFTNVQDDANNMAHGGVHCQLLDNLALGSFIHHASITLDFRTASKHVLNKVVTNGQLAQVEISYQSRAPPTVIL